MSFLKTPHLDLTTSRIETSRCVLVPFSIEHIFSRIGWIDYNRSHPNAQISLDMYARYRRGGLWDMKRGVGWYVDILEKTVQQRVGEMCLDRSGCIGVWVQEERQREGFASEVYKALIPWARENLDQEYLVHSLHPSNQASRKLAEKFGGILQDTKAENGNDIYHIPLR